MSKSSIRFIVINILILLLALAIAVFGKYGSVFGATDMVNGMGPESEQVQISCTCKSESIIDLFPDAGERRKAIDWFKAHGVTRVYLETFRHGRFADEELLRLVKSDFEAGGLEVYGAICPTNKKVQPLLACPYRPEQHETLRNVSIRTAKIFDRIILDDFLATECTCADCVRAKGDRSWGDVRCDVQLELGKKFILDPAREVNPDVQFFVKYPCWYEAYYRLGYDVLRETELYGHSWIGTETREPDDPAGGRRPQTQASWIQGWANDFSQGRCGGAWFDPLGTKPETYVEQARQSVLGGAREILIHSYDYLGTDTPGIAAHGNGKVEYGKADAEAFRLEKDSLLALANDLTSMEPYGVLLAKQPNVDVAHDASLNGFIPMLGIPVLPAASLKETPADILTFTSRAFPGLVERVTARQKKGEPLLLSMNLIRDLPKELRLSLGFTDEWLNRERSGAFLESFNERLFVIEGGRDPWQLMTVSPDTLNAVRDGLTAPLGLQFHAPTRVSLHLFRSLDRGLQAIENFNNESVQVTLTWLGEQPLSRVVRVFPNEDSVRVVKSEGKSIQLELAPRSLVILEN